MKRPYASAVTSKLTPHILGGGRDLRGVRASRAVKVAQVMPDDRHVARDVEDGAVSVTDQIGVSREGAHEGARTVQRYLRARAGELQVLPHFRRAAAEGDAAVRLDTQVAEG